MTHHTTSPGGMPGAAPGVPSRQAVIDHLLTLDPAQTGAEDVLAGPAAAVVVAQARAWIGNCDWPDLTGDQLAALTDGEVLDGITQHWGTLSALIEDLQTYARHDPGQLDHHLTPHHGDAGPDGARTPTADALDAPDLATDRCDGCEQTAGQTSGVRYVPSDHPAHGLALCPDCTAAGADGPDLVRAPYRDDPAYQGPYHAQELSDAYDRGDGPPGLTYSQYVAWADGPGLPAEVLEAAATEHDRDMAALQWWNTRDDVLADLAAPAREHHPAITAQMDDEQAATWHAHHDPAGIPALVQPAHLHAAIDNALLPETALDLDDGFGLDA